MHDEPGDRPPSDGPRRLARPPSERYRPRAGDVLAGEGGDAGPDRGGRDRAGQDRRSAAGPVARAVVATAIGSLALVLVGGILAVTSGLLFISGVTGAATGLLLAEAAVGDGSRGPALSRGGAVRFAVLVVLLGFVAATIGLWVVARAEGGALDPFDLMLQVYGALIPVGAVLGALTAWWGASVGPVRS